MKKNIMKIFVILISLLSLSSCSFEEFVSNFNEKYYGTNSESGFHEEDTGNSLELLNQAFNGTIDSNGNILKKDFDNSVNQDEILVSAKRLNFTSNLQSLDYLEGCTPSTGVVKGLVIPVDFFDSPISDKIYDNTAPSWQSVSSFYHNSSYGQLDLTFDILPWYRLSHHSSYYANMTEKSQDEFTGDAPGVSAIIHEVLKYAERHYDLSKYDANNDGYIDALHVVYSRPINHINSDFWWAYQYCNFEYKTYDTLCPYYYVFSSFHFLFYDNETCNARTLIHETGHLFGLIDYYDYDLTIGYNKGGLGGIDMMDMTIGDHNPYSKMLLGWIKNPIIIELDKDNQTTINLSPSYKNGDVIIICDDYDNSKGMFQTFFIIEYLDFSSTLLKNEYKDFNKNGIRVYRVNGELEKVDNEYTYFKYDNSYTQFNLIDAINKNTPKIYPQSIYSLDQCAINDNLYFKNDYELTLPYSYTSINESKKSSYSFLISNIDNEYATIIIYNK